MLTLHLKVNLHQNTRFYHFQKQTKNITFIQVLLRCRCKKWQPQLCQKWTGIQDVKVISRSLTIMLNGVFLRIKTQDVSGGTQRILFLRGSSHQKPQRYFWALQGYLFTISPEALSIKKDTWVRYSMFDAKLLKYIFRLLSQFAGGYCQGKLLIHPGSSEPHSEII